MAPKMTIYTPQFDRTDGRSVKYIPKTDKEFAALPTLPDGKLIDIGCQIWNKEDGATHWLFPAEWYEHIPAGTKIVVINGDVEEFQPGVTDNDMRFGALAYGFIKPKSE